jgi:hypothetical protein
MSHSPEVGAERPRRELRRRRLVMVAVLATLLAACGVVYFFPPTDYSFYPRCFFHDLTGLHCPGCGGTRCAFALLHGDLAQAAAYNILVLIYLPYLSLTGLNACWHAVFDRPMYSRKMPAWTIRATAVLMVLFWILRNLPYAPFTLLAPHKL